MSELAAPVLKICMLGVFAFWVWDSRKEPSAQETHDPSNDISTVAAALLLSVFSFAILAIVCLRASDEAARLRAILYPFSLLLTLLLECSFAALWGYRKAKELGCVALCSLVTHPTLHLIALLPGALFGEALFDDHWAWYLEAMVVVAESFLLNRALPCRRADNPKLAMAMNAFSFYGGLAIVWGLRRMLG